jgi:hypothetical protein
MKVIDAVLIAHKCFATCKRKSLSDDYLIDQYTQEIQDLADELIANGPIPPYEFCKREGDKHILYCDCGCLKDTYCPYCYGEPQE